MGLECYRVYLAQMLDTGTLLLFCFTWEVHYKPLEEITTSSLLELLSLWLNKESLAPQIWVWLTSVTWAITFLYQQCELLFVEFPSIGHSIAQSRPNTIWLSIAQSLLSTVLCNVETMQYIPKTFARPAPGNAPLDIYVQFLSQLCWILYSLY